MHRTGSGREDNGTEARRGLLAASVLAAMGVCLFSATAGESRLTYADLAGRLTDLERLAVLPEPGEQTRQWSSYDRASRYDAQAGRYINWGANGDGAGIIRTEGSNSVLAEMDGPGCIVRIWSARPLPKGGHVKVYLDGEASPAIDLAFKKYFDGTVEPFTRPELGYESSAGWNNFTPIPYAKSCRIVAEPNWGRYYHFDYVTFPKGTEVPTFRMKLAPDESRALDAANGKLALMQRGADPAGKRRGEKTETIELTLPPGAKQTVLKLDGPRAITAIRMRTPLPKEERVPESFEVKNREEQIVLMRELALSITWDGAPQPQVWSPLGDFFGVVGEHPCRCLPTGLTEDKQWYSLWYMPFAASAALELANDGQTARTVRFEITHAPLTAPISRLTRFHAKWHRDAFNPEQPDRRPDWTMLKTAGCGRFVGAMLHVVCYGGMWWGEGDEKFFVDGEKFPSIFGTGSEDYFGYGWGCGKRFERAFHAQPFDTNNHGHVNLSRWQIADNVPFQSSMEAALEKCYGANTYYAMVAYWYLAPGGEDAYAPVPVDERTGYWIKWKPFRQQDAIEGETLKVTRKTGGGCITWADYRYRPKNLVSNDRALKWINPAVGNVLDLAVPVATSGTYNVTAVFLKDRQCGVVAVSLDGKRMAEAVDLFGKAVDAPAAVKLGTAELTAGDHVLSLRIVGQNPAASQRHNVGLDYLQLRRTAVDERTAARQSPMPGP